MSSTIADRIKKLHTSIDAIREIEKHLPFNVPEKATVALAEYEDEFNTRFLQWIQTRGGKRCLSEDGLVDLRREILLAQILSFELEHMTICEGLQSLKDLLEHCERE